MSCNMIVKLALNSTFYLCFILILNDKERCFFFEIDFPNEYNPHRIFSIEVILESYIFLC